MFKGIYHGKRAHVPDLVSVLRRAQQLGIDHVMVTAGSLADIHEATLLIEQVSFEFPGMLGTTVGVHPTRVSEFESHPTGPTAHLQELIGLIRRHRELNIKAVGEFGLDYDRIQFSSPSLQRIYFEQQFVLAEESGLPLFLHMRDAAKDFIEIVKRNRHRFKHGVVHSFTGTAEEAKEILDLDLYIGINGCSLKTAENLLVVKTIPVDRIMVESDAPWCEIRPSHAGFAHIQTKVKAMAKEKHSPDHCVKSRNEPLASRQVLEVIAALYQVPLEELAETVYQTTIDTFG